MAYAICGGVVLALAILLTATNVRAGGLRPDDPAALARTRSLGKVIAETTTRPVHIIFVHGMRAPGPGTAQTFMSGLCRYAPVTCTQSQNFQPSEHKIFNLGAWPTQAAVTGRQVWASQADWDASQPFVDRYVFQRAGASPVIVDEVNWWPLLFPFKCRFLVAPDAQLSGVDRADLALCMKTEAPFHAWLTQPEYEAALKGPTISGGGAWANATLKQQIMNWGLSDAVLSLGPMRRLFRQTMDQTFEYAATYDGHDVDDQEFVVVSESLGSFVVMDALENTLGESPHARAVLTRTSDLYFFANQFALLELGRVSHLTPPAQQPLLAAAAPAAEASPFEMLQHWAQIHANAPGVAPPRPKQIIAFSDPSDLLTFQVPHLTNPDGSEAAIVVNVYDCNEISWFGLFADPTKAHTGHSANSKVLKLMFTPGP